eukprot:GHVL01002238.1.p1 GENE.GHVL01002238.1~~GHVL01002238.1.p1  ORF type:complete len:304 (-),score=37.27 GHVL01002238.1:520-1431(-)
MAYICNLWNQAISIHLRACGGSSRMNKPTFKQQITYNVLEKQLSSPELLIELSQDRHISYEPIPLSNRALPKLKRTYSVSRESALHTVSLSTSEINPLQDMTSQQRDKVVITRTGRVAGKANTAECHYWEQSYTPSVNTSVIQSNEKKVPGKRGRKPKNPPPAEPAEATVQPETKDTINWQQIINEQNSYFPSVTPFMTVNGVSASPSPVIGQCSPGLQSTSENRNVVRNPTYAVNSSGVLKPMITTTLHNGQDMTSVEHDDKMKSNIGSYLIPWNAPVDFQCHLSQAFHSLKRHINGAQHHQ